MKLTEAEITAARLAGFMARLPDDKREEVRKALLKPVEVVENLSEVVAIPLNETEKVELTAVPRAVNGKTYVFRRLIRYTESVRWIEVKETQ